MMVINDLPVVVSGFSFLISIVDSLGSEPKLQESKSCVLPITL